MGPWGKFNQNITIFSQNNEFKNVVCKFASCLSQLQYPDSKVHGANMGPTWVMLSPVGPHVGPMNLAIWDASDKRQSSYAGTIITTTHLFSFRWVSQEGSWSTTDVNRRCYGKQWPLSAWISDHMPCKVWNEIIYPFPNCKGCTVEVWERVSNFIPHFIMNVITHPCWNEG